jgi:hypothetical protein
MGPAVQPLENNEDTFRILRVDADTVVLYGKDPAWVVVGSRTPRAAPPDMIGALM